MHVIQDYPSIYLSININIYIYIYVCMYVCMYVWYGMVWYGMYVCMYIHTYIHLLVYVYACRERVCARVPVSAQCIYSFSTKKVLSSLAKLWALSQASLNNWRLAKSTHSKHPARILPGDLRRRPGLSGLL